jgi:apolipoprotein N-acyltransferase
VRSLAPLALALVGVPLLAGAAGGLGRPGIDWTPLYFASELLFAYLALGAASPVHAAIIGVAWGTGLFAFIALGTLSWGWSVPLALTAIGVGLYALPLALWSHGAPRLFHGWRLFCATAAAWSLCLDCGDALRFPLKEGAQSLVVAAPVLASGARLVGSNVISGILAATVVASADSLHARSRAALLPRLVGLLPALGVGLAALALLAALAQVSAEPPGRSIEVGVPQIDTEAEYYSARLLRPELAERFDRRFEQLLGELAGTDVVITTEGFDGRFGLSLRPLTLRYQRYAREHDQALVVTSFTAEPNGWKGNAVGAIDRQGRLVGIHRKVDLALEGERMLAPGPGYEVFPLEQGLVLGVPLCVESLLRNAPFAMTRAGATLLAASTSDLTFGSNVTGFEHLATTALRAIETGRSIVWASNGGPSGVIDRWGAFDAKAPFREAAAVRARATLQGGLTPYLAHARAVSIAAALVLLLLVVAARGSARLPRALEQNPMLLAAPARAALALAASITGAVLLIALGPALVECSRGSAARAFGAVSETFGEKRFTVPRNALARFRTTKDATASGAIAYFSTYYGLDATVASLPAGLAAASSLDDVGRQLETELGIATTRIRIDAARLPRVAAIVRRRAGGFAVVSDPAGDGRPTLFLPEAGLGVPADPAKVAAGLEPIALIPQ